MSNVLLVTSSPRGGASYSTQVARALVAKLANNGPVTERDLALAPLPHIGDDFVNGRLLPADQQSAAQKSAMAPSDEVVRQVVEADTIVIAVAMHNFGLPSTLKSWIDHLVRPGVTFSYGSGGPEGLVKGKKVYLVQAKGGVYSQGPMLAYDFVEPYLRNVLGFMGMTDVETIAVEGVAFGPEAAEKAVNAALGQVAAIRQAA